MELFGARILAWNNLHPQLAPLTNTVQAMLDFRDARFSANLKQRITGNILNILNGHKSELPVQVFTIDNKHPVAALHGSKGLMACGELHAGDVMEYTGQWYDHATLRKIEIVHGRRNMTLGITLNPILPPQWNNSDIYNFVGGETFYVDGAICVDNKPTLGAYINDVRGNVIDLTDPINYARASLINCRFLEVLVRGAPRMFILITKAISAGTELLIDYGTGYWDAFNEDLMKKSLMPAVPAMVVAAKPDDKPALAKKAPSNFMDDMTDAELNAVEEKLVYAEQTIQEREQQLVSLEQRAYDQICKDYAALKQRKYTLCEQSDALLVAMKLDPNSRKRKLV